MKRISESNAPTWVTMSELFQELGYFPADDVSGDELCCYLELNTGLDVIDTVTIVATFYEDVNELFVEVASTAYSRGIHNGSPNDMFVTFISRDSQITSIAGARHLLVAAEKAARQYISAMSTMEHVKV